MPFTDLFAAARRALSALQEPPVPHVTAWGRDESCRLPLPLVARIVEEIDPRGIHRGGGTTLSLDGCTLSNLADRGIEGLTPAESRALVRAGSVGIESAAMSFRGDVQITDCPEQLVARAQDRGRQTGFRYADTVLGMAAQAAAVSGRAPSGATPR